MKNGIKGYILGILTMIVVGVSAAVIYSAKEVSFVPSNSSWNVTNVEDAINDINSRCVVKSNLVGEEWLYNYTGSYEIFDVPYTGTYKIELWGAQGNYSTRLRALGGNGAYTKGEIELTAGTKLYVYVGQNRTDRLASFNAGSVGGSDSDTVNSGSTNGYGGGGATDIRLVSGEWNNSESLASRIMVAAGGGGGTDYAYPSNGGVAGGLIGGSGISGYYPKESAHTSLPTGGTQVSGGTPSTQYYSASYKGNAGSFGIGGDASSQWGSGGGGGYYGGAGGGATSCVVDSGAGGSSYISGYIGCVAITSQTDITPKSGCTTGTTDIECSKHYSGYVFNETVMKAGNEDMPSHDGSTSITGNTGNGYAKITLVSLD